MTQSQTDLRNGPDANGLFGAFGGRYVAETLMPLILELAREYEAAKIDPAFNEELAYFQRDYVGRPSPLYFAERLTEFCGGAKIYLKREELNHTGAHKINNCIGQILLARRMGKKRIIAETGAGMHGVATATVAARFGLQCVIYMGTTDIERQQANVFRMKLLGAEVIPVVAGTGTLKDAVNEALRDWVTNVDSTFYLIGTVAGPHPYPAMVRDFQSVIGKETRTQLQAQEGRLPDSLVACIGGGSNAMGLFHPFLDDTSVEIIGVEAAGHGIETGKHAASLNGGVPGVLHGNRTFLLQDDDGQIIDAHSISAGLDYPGIGPEHAWLYEIGRVEYCSIKDDEALAAFHQCCRLDGIIPALESAHALAEVFKRAPTLAKDHLMVVNLSGRGDKDMQTVMHYMQQAEQELAALRKIMKDPLLDGPLLSKNTTKTVLSAAPEVLAGEIAAARGQFDQAIAHLENAVRLEDALVYTEPLEFHLPPRLALGAILLKSGRTGEAETVYWEDLRRNRNNGWALYGLMQALRAQKKDDQAAVITARFEQAWARADVKLSASRFGRE